MINEIIKEAMREGLGQGGICAVEGSPKWYECLALERQGLIASQGSSCNIATGHCVEYYYVTEKGKAK